MLFSRERGGATSATLHWEIVMESETASNRREPWNKGKLVGQKAPFKSKEIWAIRVRLQMAERARELALFNLGIDSKLRACDLTALRVRDICHGDQVSSRAIVLQRKRSGQCSSRSRRRRGRRCKPGSGRPDSNRAISFFRAAAVPLITSERASTPGSSARGSRTWDWILQATGRTPYVAPRRR